MKEEEEDNEDKLEEKIIKEIPNKKSLKFPKKENRISITEQIILQTLNSSNTNPTLRKIESISIIQKEIKILEKDLPPLRRKKKKTEYETKNIEYEKDTKYSEEFQDYDR